MGTPRGTKSRKHKGKFRLNDRLHNSYGNKYLDEIQRDLMMETKINLDGEILSDNNFYCVECDRTFIDQKILTEHKQNKRHKRRVKELKEKVQTVKDSEMAGGLY